MKTITRIMLIVCMTYSSILAQSIAVFDCNNYYSRMFENIDSETIETNIKYNNYKSRNINQIVSGEITRLIKGSRISHILNMGSTETANNIFSLESYLVHYYDTADAHNSNLLFFTYERKTKKVLVHKLHKIPSDNLNLFSIKCLEDNKHRLLLFESIYPQFKRKYIKRDSYYDIPIVFKNNTLVFVVAIKDRESKKIGYVCFDIDNHCMYISEILSFQDSIKKDSDRNINTKFNMNCLGL